MKAYINTNGQVFNYPVMGVNSAGVHVKFNASDERAIFPWHRVNRITGTEEEISATMKYLDVF